jgi:hypothetical protein
VGRCVTLVASQTNSFQDFAVNSGARRTRIPHLEGVGQEASQPCDQNTLIFTPYWTEGSKFQAEPASQNQTSPLGTTRPSHLTSSSVFSFISFVSVEPSRQHAPEFDHQISAAAVSIDSELVFESGGSSSHQSPTTGIISINDTPASSTDVLDSLPHVDDVTPTVQELNAHRHSHDLSDLFEPPVGAFLNLDDDLAFHMDVVGIGEQFTGMLDISSQTL